MVAFGAISVGLLLSQAWTAVAAEQDATVNTSPDVMPPSLAERSTETSSDLLERLSSFAYNSSMDKLASESKSKRDHCGLMNLRIRRDWRFFFPSEKREYIEAVRCLQQTPSRTPDHLAPGAKSRYDDFVATHINQTMNIHYTGTFLAWHRYFIYEFEEALREDCGYRGDLPYWNWPYDTDSLERSEVFDGSDTSMSGNGEYIPNKKDIELTMAGEAPIRLPAGTGGGCVTSGAFVDYSVNLGPAALQLPGGKTASVKNPLEYNPRCFKRDLTTEILREFANFPAVIDLIFGNDNIRDFQMTMQGVPGSGNIGVHGGGHYSMGGDPGRDLWVSPGDPAFWHHHGMIDRVWWLWQSLDWQDRQDAIAGTNTFLDNPPSANTTLDTIVDLGYANGEPMQMRDLMSTVGGPFCYIYL